MIRLASALALACLCAAVNAGDDDILRSKAWLGDARQCVSNRDAPGAMQAAHNAHFRRRRNGQEGGVLARSDADLAGFGVDVGKFVSGFVAGASEQIFAVSFCSSHACTQLSQDQQAGRCISFGIGLYEFAQSTV